MKHAGSAANHLGAAREESGDGRNREWQLFSEEIRTLVRQLIAQSRGRGALQERSDGSSVVILDLVVDGVRCVLSRRRAGEEPRAEGVTLSPREREIARMVAKGYPNKVIARVLEISSWTVSTHLRRVFAKLGVSSRAAMVAQLLEEGKLGAGSPAADPQALDVTKY